MKKLFITALILVAIASFGGTIPGAQAAELTPAERAVLQQSLDVLKAKLLQLQAQASAQQLSSPAVSGAPLTLQAAPAASALSASEVAAMKTALAALATTLSGFQAAIGKNPQLIAKNAEGVSAVFKSMGATLALIGTELQGMNLPAAAPSAIAEAAPPAPFAPAAPSLAPGSQPLVSANQPLAASNPVNIVSPAGESANAQTAQAASSWSLKNLNWPVVTGGILVILAVIIWLWWPSGSKEDRNAMKRNTPIAPLQSSVFVSHEPRNAGVAKSAASAPQTSFDSPQQRKSA